MKVDHVIDQLADLRALFAQPSQPALFKEVDSLHPVYQRWINASRYLVLATSGRKGVDVSPRGDRQFVAKILDSTTIAIPERQGNNRVDSLQNILHCNDVGLFFLIPGVGESMRVRGTAQITTDPALLESLAIEGKKPVCAILVKVKAAFFQCSRAALRSGLWVSADEPPLEVPRPGEMLQALSGGAIDGVAYDLALPERLRASL
jgi:hypothetical protein